MTNDNKIKIGIIGAGRMGITHYSIINIHPSVEILAVADPSPLINSLMSKYLHIKVFNQYENLLKLKLDALLVCTPPIFHYPIIKKAAELGLHVFVEKPFTTNVNEASSLASLYSGTNLINQVGYVNRFNDVFIKVKEFVNMGLIGKIYRFKSEMFSSTVSNNSDGNGWRSLRKNGGGVTYEMASHAIDLIHYFLGIPDKVIGTSINNIYSKNVEDVISTTLVYHNGLSGTLYVNWCDSSYRKPVNKIELYGYEGKILADQYSLKIYLNNSIGNLNLRQGWNTLYITDLFQEVPFYVRGMEFTKQLWHFVGCIKGSEDPIYCTFKDGVQTLEVINKIFNDYKLNEGYTS